MNPEITLLKRVIKELDGSPSDFDAILEQCRGKRVVLLGEASHGTHEFYRVRGEITKRLIREEGFHAVAAEADWPDAHRVNEFVQGRGSDAEAVEALGGFRRFPQWMWRNTDVLDFIGWLRNRNDSMKRGPEGLPRGGVIAGFYGLDLYSLNSSREAVLRYVRDHNPSLAARVAERYDCFDRYGGDTRRYGLLAGSGMSGDCEKEVVSVLTELHRERAVFLGGDGRQAEDAFFDADQNARVVKDAEEYYRTMFRSDVSSWNLRDHHMMRSLRQLITHLEQHHGEARVVVWAHNSHLGNARATSMGARGELNIGQLVRDHFGREALSVGFTTHGGTVTAASDWDGPAERKRVRPGMEGSYEELFHETGIPSFWLDCHRDTEVSGMLRHPRLERAIGVIYRPDTERQSHYFMASLPDQFDGILHYDRTRAVEPLERTVEWEAGEVGETYPSGL
jgi:erythromycin esterase-like protein